GTVGSEEKAKIAKAHGCDYPVIYTREDCVARVKEITRDQKLPVVYDSVGKDIFMKSLDCLRPKGMMVSFGQSGLIGLLAKTLRCIARSSTWAASHLYLSSADFITIIAGSNFRYRHPSKLANYSFPEVDRLHHRYERRAA